MPVFQSKLKEKKFLTEEFTVIQTKMVDILFKSEFEGAKDSIKGQI